MTILATSDAASDIKRYTATSPVSADVAQDFLTGLFASSDYSPSSKILITFPPGTGMPMSSMTVGNVIERLSLQSPKGEGASRKLAFVCPADLEFGLGRMFCSLGVDAIPFSSRTFRTEDEAVNWLEN